MKHREDVQPEPPNPGSDEALREGCNCPVLDNSHGLGRGGDGARFGWWVADTCQIHGRYRTEWQTTVERDEDGRPARMVFMRRGKKC